MFRSKNKRYERTCRTCGRSYTVNSGGYVVDGRHYCTSVCLDNARIKPIYRVCACCGRKFDARGAMVKVWGKYYCYGCGFSDSGTRIKSNDLRGV